MYPGLTQGAIAALSSQLARAEGAVPAEARSAGEWAGTMNLTEPQCGTDLGLLRTRAVPQADGSYKITGTKIFISAGEHDLTDNIIHLVLARIEGAPAGTKGISLFIVPKFLPGADGALGARNGVTCGSIEEKMGIHGNATCVMNYDGATGWLIGEANRGLQAMFVMMNEARLGVGVQGLALSEVAYQNAAAYAKERLAGRALSRRESSATAGRSDHRASGRAPHAADDPRLQRGGARARALDGAEERRRASLAKTPRSARRPTIIMGLMTPVIKGVLTDQGFANTVAAQQVFGGHGYIAEHGMEQFVRDARIAMIYEGANGIQALDLVGRKLPQRRRPRAAGLLRRGLGLHQGARRRCGYGALCEAARAGARRIAAGHHVVRAERAGQSRQCRRRRHRLHAALRPGRARLYVVPDRGSRQEQSSAEGRGGE